MTPKELSFNKEARQKLLDGITKLSDAVKSTLGPMGSTVLIESPEHTHGITVTKDGVTVANSILLIEPTENLAVRILKEAAKNTALDAGDGTTTAIVLAEALVKKGSELITEDVNRTEVLRQLRIQSEEVVSKLKEWSAPVEQHDIEHIATISSNNDKLIGSLISDVYERVGTDGIVTIEHSVDGTTHCEATKGIKVLRGYSSPLFVNNQVNDECIFEDAHVLISDAEISNILQIEKVLKPIVEGNKKLLIIAPCSQNVINTLAANVMKNGLKLCHIPPPDFGYRQHELMQDIAIAVGATYFSEKTGDDLSIMNFTDLGLASKVIVGSGSTIIISDDAEVDERVKELENARKQAKNKKDKDFISQRIASLKGGIGVVRVGGSTDLERKELYDRVEDAICAVRSALEEGVLPGAGMPLYTISQSMLIMNEEEERIARAILYAALEAPLLQILKNGGLKYEEVYKNASKKETNLHDWGYDLKNKEWGDLKKMGVIDPTKVTRIALENAISVAITILSTDCIVTMQRA